LQSKVKNVRSGSSMPRPWSFRFFTTLAPPKSRAMRASISMSTMSPGTDIPVPAWRQ
jgi:hypothetical protein